MDQFLFFMLGLAGAGLFGSGYFIGLAERNSRRTVDIHSGPDDVEKRARRAF